MEENLCPDDVPVDVGAVRLLKLVAGLFLFLALFSVAEALVLLFHDGLYINISGLIGFWAYFGLRAHRRGWRIYALVVGGITTAAILLVVVLGAILEIGSVSNRGEWSNLLEGIIYPLSLVILMLPRVKKLFTEPPAVCNLW